MEVATINLTLLFNSILLISAHGLNNDTQQEVDGVYVHIDPNRLQFFEYESIAISCAASREPTEWRVMKRLSLISTRWETSTGPMIIKPAFVSHSGEYFCENKEGKKTKTVNIKVTAADVILESPALSVMVGDTVTLYCKKRESSELPADFYKDGRVINTGYKGGLTIGNISMFDEGFYKCSIIGSQNKSPESWLSVTTPQEKITMEKHGSTQLFTLLFVILTTLCIAGPGLYVGLRHYRDHQEENVAEYTKVLYIVVTRKKDDTGHKGQQYQTDG